MNSKIESLPQKRVLMEFMNSLDFIKIEKFTGFRVSDSLVLAKGVISNNHHH